MITKGQISELEAKYKIDSFTIFREYLQLVFLNYLYQNPAANKIYFKGGTAIHLLLGSARFSEDLDFSTEYSQKEIKKIIREVEEEVIREIPEVKISLLYRGRKSVRFRLRYQSLDFKYPLVIRLDFTQQEKPEKIITSPLITKYPIAVFCLVVHLSLKEILAEKIRAFLTRAKGRDLFDLWFLLGKDIKINPLLVNQKLKEVGKKFNREIFYQKIKAFPLGSLKADLTKFLSEPQRKIIPILKTNLLASLKKTAP